MRAPVVTTFAILVALLAGLLSLSCRGAGPGSAQPIVVSYAPFQTLALLWLADEQALFKQNGIDVTLREYATGAAALDAVLKGEADIAVGPAEFPVVGRALSKERLRVLGSIDKVDHVGFVGRKDRGIQGPSTLRGKRIGTTRGTVAEFYLGRFLELNGVDGKDVTVVDLKTPPEWVDAVVTGAVDAVVTAEPYVNSARVGLGSNAVSWSAQGGQPSYALIVAGGEEARVRPEVVRKFLTSLLQAEKYASGHPAEARAVVQRRLNVDAAYVEAIWGQNQYELSLEQSLITAMEDQARWMMKNGLTSQTQVPDFAEYVDAAALKAVKPEAVNIIR